MIYKKWFEDGIAIVGFFIIIGIFFSPTILQGKLPVPSDSLVGLYHPWRDLYSSEYPRGIPFKNFLITDPVRQQIPWRKVAIDQWKTGSIPWWNPYSFSGTPLAANIQAAVFYPFNIFFFLFDFKIAWTVLIILQPLLAGVFLYAYLRHLKLSSLSSLYGAISWSFSGFIIAWLTWGTIVHVVLWLPLILLAIDKLIESKKSIALHSTVLWFIVLVTALSMQFFAGHAQMSLYVLILSTIYAIWQLLLIKTDRTKKIRWLLFCFSLFVVITSVQWIPFLRATVDSSRLLETAAWTKPGWFLPWQHLVQFVAPDFFGNPATLNYFGQWNYGEFVGYISIAGLVFASFALFDKKKSPDVKFWGWLLIVALLFALPTPLAKLPYELNVPFLSALQPTRLMAIIDFSLVMLSALGFERWRKNKDKRIWAAVGIVGIILLILWAVSLISDSANMLIARRNLFLPSAVFLVIIMAIAIKKRRLAAGIIVAVVAFDLLRFGWKFTPFTTSEYFFPNSKLITFLQQSPKPFRFMSLDDKILPPNVSAYYGLESIEGYDPIYPHRYEQFVGSLEKGSVQLYGPYGFNRIITAHNRLSPLLEFLNVKYVLSLDEIHDTSLVKVFEEGQTKVYVYVRGNSRAYFAYPIIYEPNEVELLRRMQSTHEDNTSIAYVIDSIPIPTVPLDQAWMSIREYSADYMKIETITSQDRFLIIVNMFTPQSHVAIDGVPQKVYRVNYLFMGVQVPAGKHIITTYMD